MVARDDALGKSFVIDLHQVEDGHTLALSGAFGSECREQFELQIDSVRQVAAARLVLDLRGLTFIDSAGLAMLLTASRNLQEAGIPVVVVRGRGQVRRVFELTGAEQALTVVDGPPA